MSMTVRILVVDDSAVVRKLVTMAIEPEPGLEVVGAARDGASALAMVDELQPDLVTLDVEMPGIDGLSVLEELHRRRPGLAVIMFASLNERDAEVTLTALRAGALDFVTKPVARSSDEAIALIRTDLVPKIRALAPRSRFGTARLAPDRQQGVGTPEARSVTVELTLLDPARPGSPRTRALNPVDRRITARRTQRDRNHDSYDAERDAQSGAGSSQGPSGAFPSGAPTLAGRRLRRGGRADIVVIGVSTGGPAALDHVLGGLPADFRVPIVIVQHMPRLFTDILAQRLDAKCALRVRTAETGAELLPGDVWLAPGGRHLEVVSGEHGAELAVTHGPPENSCKPSVDVLFRSVAATYGSHVLALILTGMGMDGTSGAAAVAEAGGTVVAQDEHTSVVWGMPSSVIDQGLANQVVALEQVAPLLVRRVGRLTGL